MITTKDGKKFFFRKIRHLNFIYKMKNKKTKITFNNYKIFEKYTVEIIGNNLR